VAQVATAVQVVSQAVPAVAQMVVANVAALEVLAAEKGTADTMVAGAV
jgi:hypothetical protein